MFFHFRPALAAAAFASVAGILGPGCGGRVVVDAPELSTGAACARYFDTLCDRYGECMPSVTVFDFGTVDACKAGFREECKAAATLPDVGIDPAAITACATQMASASCDEVFGRFGLPTCARSLRGGRGAGSPCASRYQCTGFSCLSDPGSACGKCAPTLGEGEGDCTTAQGFCADGLTCGSDGTCRTPAPRGAPCSTTAPCDASLTCVDGTCAALLGAHAACDPSESACDPWVGLTCDAATGTCAQRPDDWGRAGESCDGQHPCAGNLVCEGGQCVLALMPGSSCAANSAACARPATCVADTCALVGRCDD